MQRCAQVPSAKDGDRIMVLETCGRDGLSARASNLRHRRSASSDMHVHHLRHLHQVSYLPRFAGDAEGVPGELAP